MIKYQQFNKNILQRVLYIFLAFTLFFQGLFAQLPDLGNSSSGILNSAQEKIMGKQFIRYVKKLYILNNDPLLSDYIESLGFSLVARSPAPGKHFDFFIVNSPEINAFAGPYGYIGINSGLFLASQSESELAAVMAHEIAHVTQQHIMRSIDNAQRAQALTIPAIIAGMLIGAVTDPNIGSGVVAAGLGGATQNIINFTRANEQEADRVGIQILYEAGFDPTGMVTFFYRLQEQNRLMAGDLPEFLRTHPVTESRIADSANRAEQYPEQLYQDSSSYQLLKQRLRVLTTNNSQNLITFYKNKLKNTDEVNLVFNYGYALALSKANQYQEALAIIEPLAEQYPYNMIIQLGLAETYMAMRDYKQALISLENLYSLYPDSYPVILTYAQALNNTKATDELITLLTKAIDYYPGQAILRALVAQAYADNDQHARAYYQRAWQLYLEDNKELAIIQLQLALQQKDITPQIETRVNRLLDQWQEHE